ncbi:HDOD domain-containing protein [Oleiagrimonas sp. C23AA]|uniref:HDOD domain-containing protein n=1 Tax=Oleiagrimonas sp. C23AA TaxID=2719047 RepID=UPI001423D4DD|nr:HDOD domain-containing protein [Oleiagrimonas sp. C23AA]NII12181.1 HDOD domain-containing protein [Oleiagrimonas sp. C23AA]
MRVMFLDDEDQTLKDIEHGLSALGHRWDLVVAESINQAMAAVDEAPVDVVVVDLDMPNMDGTQLLRLLRTRHPTIIRMAFAGVDDREASVRALDLAHQCLPKPCDIITVAETIERAVALRNRMESVELQRVIGQVDRLPSAPRMYMRLRSLLGDPEAHGKSVAELLDQDPGLTAKVLQLANSAYFSSGAPITGVAQAVLRIGLDAVRIAVLANEVFDAHRGQAIAELRSRAVRASQLAARIAESGDREPARTAALLSYVGWLVPGVEALCAAEAGHSKQPPTPEEVGAYLLGMWGLPSTIVEAVAHHRQPSAVPQSRFDVLGVTHVATALVNNQEPDMDYLQSLGMVARWPHWKRLAEDYMEPEEA